MTPSLLDRVFAAGDETLQRLDSDEVAQRVVAAAFEEIAVHGWQRVRMQDIAKRSGLGRATVYRRFANKDDLLEALLLTEVRKYLIGNANARAGFSDPVDRLAESAAYAVGYLQTHPMLERMLTTEPDAVALKVNSNPVITLVRDLLAQLWQQELHGDVPITDERRQHLRTVAELHVRLTLSLLVNDDSVIPLSTVRQARAFARRYLAPLLDA